MSTPTIHIPPIPTDSTVDRDTSILDTTGFNKKLAATDNTLQELATAFDEHSHTIVEVLSTDRAVILNDTEATNSTDGSIATAGGLSIAKAIYANTTLKVNGISTLGATTGATVSAVGIVNVVNATDALTGGDGSLQTAGGLSVVKKAFIGETVTCTGILPAVDDTSDLGSGALRWNDIYATNATIQVSDKRLKKDIKTQDLGLSFILSLEPVQYRMLNGSRLHEGFLAQDIEAYLPRDSSMLIKSKEGQYGLRYSEFISPIVLAIQELSEKVDKQPKEIEVIREIVNSPKEVIREIETIHEIKVISKEIEYKTSRVTQVVLVCSIAISIASIVLQFIR